MRATFPHVEFVEGWRENIYASIRSDDRSLLNLDDQMDEAGDSKTVSKLFTKGSHHSNLTNLFSAKCIQSVQKPADRFS